jgi:hypothetical protein
MNQAALAVALSLAVVGSAAAQTATPPAPEKKGGPAITRIAYWSTKAGKGTEARAFWKQFTPVFDEMKKKGLLIEYQFLSPALHTGQEWDLAYLWVCKDMVSYGQADQFFSDAISKMDDKKIGADFDAAFDGAKHRDELWRSVEIK